MQKFSLVASGTTSMGQDEVWWSSPAEVQRMALGIVSGAGVRMYAAGAWWRPTSSGLDCVAQNKSQWKAGEGAFFRLLSLILFELACQSHGVSATCGVFFCSSVWTAVCSLVSCGGGQPPSFVRPRTLHLTSRLGTSYPRFSCAGKRKENERIRG